ncbi:hypothetical protein, partial [Pseudomonas sp. FW305-53]|uniref:hypothetical protein n=1 Tax=Pseudomonas sp. FW305-53 TaxID=2070638 RepID=UPI001C473491
DKKLIKKIHTYGDHSWHLHGNTPPRRASRSESMSGPAIGLPAIGAVLAGESEPSKSGCKNDRRKRTLTYRKTGNPAICLCSVGRFALVPEFIAAIT